MKLLIGFLLLISCAAHAADNVSATTGASGKAFFTDSSGQNWPASVVYTTDGNGNRIPISAGGGGGGGGTVTQGPAGTAAWLTSIVNSALPLPTNACQETGGHLASIDTKLSSPMPVSGTFWQSTQPVSGTLTCNAGTGTQNVSVQNSSIPVTGTFYQATQPVSGTVGISGTVPVSGTFYQTTQPVSASALPLPSNAAQETGGNLAATASSAATTATNTANIGSASILFEDFSQVAASGVSSSNLTLRQTGSGMTVSQSAGNLVIASGTNANAETIIRSNTGFTGSLVVKEDTILSQRIVNNNFYIELVDVVGNALAFTINSATSVTVTFSTNPFTSANVGQSMNLGDITGAAGIPMRAQIASVAGSTVTYTVAGWPASGTGTLDVFGWNYYHLLYTNVTATNANVGSQRNGWQNADYVATINPTASPGHLATMQSEDNTFALWDQLIASGTTAASALRSQIYTNIPPYSTPLYLQIHVLNGTTAPASTTTWTIDSVQVDQITSNPVTIGNVRQQSVQGQLPVQIVAGTLPTVSTVTTVSNIAAFNSGAPNMNITNGSTNKAMTVAVGAASTNLDYSAQAWAAVSGTGATIAPAIGDGQSVSFAVNVTAWTAGASTGLYVYLQESPDNGVTWMDIWECEPFTGVGFARIPAIPVGGRRRMRWVNRAGAATTATVTVTAMASPGVFPLQRQFFDWGTTGTAANTNLITGAAATTTTATMTSALSATSTYSAVYPIDGLTQLTVKALVSGGTATTAPIITLQYSDDYLNWVNGSTLTLPLTAGMSMTTVNNINAKYVRAALTTAQAGGTAVALTYLSILGQAL